VRALIVDDNATNGRVLTEMVTAWGCHAVTADGPEEAMVLQGAAADGGNPFDVLLLDRCMPGVDGYGLARLVRADPRLAGTPMIMLTSSAQRGEVEKSEQAGIVAHLTKPVRSGPLRAAINSAVHPGLTASISSPPNGGAVAFEEGPGRATQLPVVLVVEDNVVNQKVLTAILASIHYGVDIAVNGYEALEKLDRNRYAAVLMDCQMPVMDGYQATGELRLREGSDRHTPVIALTASAMAADRERCLHAGMDDYLSKPVNAEDLATTLASWLSGRSQVPSPAGAD